MKPFGVEKCVFTFIRNSGYEKIPKKKWCPNLVTLCTYIVSLVKSWYNKLQQSQDKCNRVENGLFAFYCFPYCIQVANSAAFPIGIILKFLKKIQFFCEKFYQAKLLIICFWYFHFFSKSFPTGILEEFLEQTTSAKGFSPYFRNFCTYIVLVIHITGPSEPRGRGTYFCRSVNPIFTRVAGKGWRF